MAGEFLMHLSFVLSLAAYWVRDVVWLRLLVIASCLVWLCAMALSHWIGVSAIWNVIFIAINAYNIVILLNENRSVRFTEDEQELYETLFRSFRPGEFLKIIRIAQWKDAAPGSVLLDEGRTAD